MIIYFTMPDESKKHQNKKGKNEPKEQRQSRNQRQQTIKEKKTETTKVTPAQKPVQEEPGPEFYKNLKRETDDILKITQEENSKYKKKEIQSNWSKYEMHLPSYEDVQESENLGANFEELIQMPPSVGGHFQFKHEKSWDQTSAPSIYDKYFNIEMDSLGVALNTIPFYERNDIDISIFNESDKLNMDNRATRYKQKYYNDNTYSTPEMKAQEKNLNNLKECLAEPKFDFVNESPEAVKKDKVMSFELSNNEVFNINMEEEKEMESDSEEIFSKTNKMKQQIGKQLDKLLATAENYPIADLSKSVSVADDGNGEAFNVLTENQKKISEEEFDKLFDELLES